MKNGDPQPLVHALQELSATVDFEMRAIIESLTTAAACGERDLNAPAYLPVKERLSVIVERAVSTGDGPGKLIEVLIEIDAKLTQILPGIGPWALRFAPLVTERFLHACQMRQRDTCRVQLAQLSPIFVGDARTLIAIPVGDLGPNGVTRFIDRLLIQVFRKRPRGVLLFLAGFIPFNGCDILWRELRQDLVAQKVSFKELSAEELGRISPRR